MATLNTTVKNPEFLSSEEHEILQVELNDAAAWLSCYVPDAVGLRLVVLKNRTAHVIADFTGRQYTAEALASSVQLDAVKHVLRAIVAGARHGAAR